MIGCNQLCQIEGGSVIGPASAVDFFPFMGRDLLLSDNVCLI